MVRVLIERRCVAPVTINDGDDHNHGDARGFNDSDDDYDF